MFLFPFIIGVLASWTLFWWVKKEGGNLLQETFSNVSFFFYYRDAAFWNWNEWTGLYADEVKGLRRRWDIITALKIIALRYYSRITALRQSYGIKTGL
jgi:hypothetical protein